MTASITNKIFYENIPSASGLEVIGDSLYIIGDDSPFLYHLDRNFKEANKTTLSDTAGFESGRVAKHEKLDLESMARFEADGKSYLLILGSGASEARMTAFVIEVDAVSGKVGAVDSYALNRLYQKLQQNSNIVGSGILNIEGAAVDNGKLYLMQRAIGNEPNVLLIYDLHSFLSFLKDNGKVPGVKLKPFKLDKLKELQAGFSGAHVFDGKLFFTSSVEGTEDAIADGDVHGSFIGFIELDDLADGMTTVSPASALLVHQDGTPYVGKAESLVVSKGDKADTYKVLVVSDDDKGHSELLEVNLAF